MGKMNIESDTAPSQRKGKQMPTCDIKLQWRKKQISRQQQIFNEKKISWWTWLRSLDQSISLPNAQVSAYSTLAGQNKIGVPQAYAVGNSRSQQAMRSRRVARAAC
jgi:hypothetical protein